MLKVPLVRPALLDLLALPEPLAQKVLLVPPALLVLRDPLAPLVLPVRSLRLLL